MTQGPQMRIRLSLLCLLAVGSVLPSRADGWNYFYTCGSGIVDCSDFPKHYYGDFGYNGFHEFGDPATVFDVDFQVVASNDAGQVVGNFVGFIENNFAQVYGAA